jgi:hypothetical protein
MSLLRWLNTRLWRPAVDRSREAEQKTDEVAEAARELNSRLRPYFDERDAFGALIVDLYNRRNEILEARQHRSHDNSI